MSRWLNKPPLGTPLISGHPHRDGLVGWWPMLEGAGGTIYNYGSAVDADLTLTNVAFPPTTNSGWNPGRTGSSPKFNGTNDYGVMGTTEFVNSARPFTITVWAYTESFVDFLPGILSFKANTTSGFMVALSNNATYRSVSWGGRDGQGWNQRKPTINWGAEELNTWNHIAIVYDGVSPTSGTSWTFYHNGRSIPVQSTSNFAEHGNVNYIGRDGTGARYHDGFIDDIRFYNKIKLQSEIRDIMHNPFEAFQKRTYAKLFVAPAVGVFVPQIVVI